MRKTLIALFFFVLTGQTPVAQDASQELAAYPLAYSERLGLRYFVVARKSPDGQWCSERLLVRVEADPLKFAPDAEFTNMTQRAGAILENRCDRAESALIYVMNPAAPGDKPLWAGRFARSGKWDPTPLQKLQECAAGDLDCEPVNERRSGPSGPASSGAIQGAAGAVARSEAKPASQTDDQHGAPPTPASPPPGQSLATRPLTSSAPASVENRAASPPAAKGKSFAGQTLARKDLGNENLRNASFERADLEGTNFTGALLENGDFRGARIINTNFRDANLTGANFTGATFDFDKGAVWVGAKLVGASLPEFKFKLVGCEGYYSKNHYELGSQRTVAMITDFNNGGLSFRNANLTNSVICGDMTGVDFRGADLRGADLSKTTELSKALLGGAKYDGATRLTVDPAQFRMTRVPDAPKPLAGFSGEWWIEKERPGQSPTPNLGYLGIDANGEFEWSPGDQDGKSIFGSWERVGDGVTLKAGESGKDWSLKLVTDKASKEDLLELKSADGKMSRTAFRKAPPKRD